MLGMPELEELFRSRAAREARGAGDPVCGLGAACWRAFSATEAELAMALRGLARSGAAGGGVGVEELVQSLVQDAQAVARHVEAASAAAGGVEVAGGDGDGRELMDFSGELGG